MTGVIPLVSILLTVRNGAGGQLHDTEISALNLPDACGPSFTSNLESSCSAKFCFGITI